MTDVEVVQSALEKARDKWMDCIKEPDYSLLQGWR
jgi:hypothetical protein